MSTLDSTSTHAEIVAAYDDNASWEEDGSATKAKAFITACRLILRLARRAAKGGRGIMAEQEFYLEGLRQEMADARGFIRNNPTDAERLSNPSVVHADFSTLRR